VSTVSASHAEQGKAERHQGVEAYQVNDNKEKRGEEQEKKEGHDMQTINCLFH